jgi:hypothetical protein
MAAEYHGQPQFNTNALEYANQMFVAVYTLECVLKLMALRWHYFKQPWNIFDFSVAIVSIVGWLVNCRFRVELPRVPLICVERMIGYQLKFVMNTGLVELKDTIAFLGYRPVPIEV